MKHKIIIADDSTSIQKFAKITLTSQGYDVVTCLKSQELMGLIQEHNPVVVLLDFNLSDSKTGYDLAREIKSISTAKVIMLYGTFDSIDDSLFVDSGISGHLVKPFDEGKLLALCKQQISDLNLEQDDETELLGGEASVEEAVSDFPDEITEDTVEVGEEWVVNQPEQIDVNSEPSDDSKDLVSSAELNSLEAGMQDWGIDVPGVIGASDNHLELPPIIGVETQAFTETSISKKVKTLSQTINDEPSVEDDSSSDAKLIGDDDFQEEFVDEEENIVFTNQNENESVNDSPEELGDFSEEKTEILNLESIGLNSEDVYTPEEEFPEVIEDDAEITEAESRIEALEEEDHIAMPSDEDLEYPDLIDMSSNDDEPLVIDNSAEVQDSFKGQELSLDATLGTDSEEEVKAIEEQIADEVEVSGEDLWQTDDIVSEDELKKPSLEESLAQAKNFLNKKETVSKPTLENIQVSEEDIQKKIESMLAPMVERMVNDRLDQIIEKVSWEVIPDLAENIIRKELQRVTNEVLNDN